MFICLQENVECIPSDPARTRKCQRKFRECGEIHQASLLRTAFLHSTRWRHGEQDDATTADVCNKSLRKRGMILCNICTNLLATKEHLQCIS